MTDVPQIRDQLVPNSLNIYTCHWSKKKQKTQIIITFIWDNLVIKTKFIGIKILTKADALATSVVFSSNVNMVELMLTPNVHKLS